MRHRYKLTSQKADRINPTPNYSQLDEQKKTTPIDIHNLGIKYHSMVLYL